MIRVFLFALIVVAIAPGLSSSRGETQLHRIDAKSPDGLHALFRYDGAAMPLVSAHRGGALPGYPENCIETFEHTLQHVFSILEIDLQYTKDGQIVLHHDATLERTTTGTGRVVDRKFQELKELRLKDKDGNVTEYCMPTLDEALQWARGKTIVILDKKDVPVEVCVKKIQEHRAQAYAMVMAYSFQDIQICHNLDPDIMMEVMIGDHQRFRGFEETGVPWNRVVAFVGHELPEDKRLLEKIHAKGACCMAGTSRNLDRQLRVARDEDSDMLEREYRSRLDFGVDLIETDLPIQVGNLLYTPPKIPAAKSSCFALPNDSHCSRMEMVRVADSGKEFTLDRSGKRFKPWGFNYVGDFGRIVEEYWEDDWPRVVKDFREMRLLGANVVRLHLQVGTYMASPDQVDQEELKRLRRILDLAEDVGLYLDLTGLGCYHLDAIPAWYDKLSEAERWRVQAKFWEAVAQTCTGHPAVFCYDLMNEPVIGEAKEGDHPWLLGEMEGFYFVQRISNRPGDRNQQTIAEVWTELLVAAIRKYDRDHLVTVGVIPWALPFPKAKPLFYSPSVAEHLDFVSVHFYPSAGEVDRALEALAVYDIGKPLVVEETFPLSCSLEELDEFIDRADDRVGGWISHFFGHTVEEHAAGAKPGGKPVAEFLKYWREKAPSHNAESTNCITIDTDSDLGPLHNFWNVFPVTDQAPFKDDGKHDELRRLYPVAKYINCVRFLGGRDLTKDDYFRGIDDDGNAVCNFTDAMELLAGIRKCGFTPWIVLDNVPAAMSEEPTKNKYGNTEPPADYKVWTSYVRQLVQALIGRFGRDEVSAWRFRVGTEPDLSPGHWSGTKEEYLAHYDHTVAAVLRVLPDADIGPGNILDPVKNEQRGWGLEIIDHCAVGRNYSTGEIGTPMRFFASSYYTAVGVSDERFDQVIETILARLGKYPQFADVPVEVHEFGILSEGGKLLAGDGTEFGGSWAAHMARKIYGQHVGRVYQWHWNTTKAGGLSIPVTHVLRMLEQMVGASRLSAVTSQESESDDIGCIASRKDDGIELLIYRHLAVRDNGQPVAVRIILDGQSSANQQWQIAAGDLIDCNHSVFAREQKADVEKVRSELGADASVLAVAIHVMARHRNKYEQMSALDVLEPLPSPSLDDAGRSQFDLELSGHSVVRLLLIPNRE